MSQVKRASALIIGDEILSGKVHDTNSFYLAKTLFEIGIDLVRIETVPDDIDDIASSVKRLSHNHDLVFTSGGIGPTHDDKTYEAIAKAFSRGLEYHQPTLDKMEEYYKSKKEKVREDAKRMAYFPSQAEILTVRNLFVPVVKCNNVYILPGVPQLFQAMLDGIVDRIKNSSQKSRIILYSPHYEVHIASIVREAQEKYQQVSIGIYPRFTENPPTMISVEGWDKTIVEECVASFIGKIDGFIDVKKDVNTTFKQFPKQNSKL